MATFRTTSLMDGNRGMSPVRAQAQFGTPAYAGMQETEAMERQLDRQMRDIQAQREAAAQRQAAQMVAQAVGTPAMAFTPDQVVGSGPSPVALQARYGAMAPAVERYLERPIPGGTAAAIMGALGMGGTAQQQLAAGSAQPALNAAGRVVGAYSTGPGGFGTVYSGMPADPHAAYMADVRPARDDIAPLQTNPQTGQPQCPDGYVYDPDLNACRLDTTPAQPVPVDFSATAPTYAQMGLLDQAPAGLLEFSQRYGLPEADFASANLAFRRGAGYRPSYFRTPRPTQGYTLLG